MVVRPVTPAAQVIADYEERNQRETQYSPEKKSSPQKKRSPQKTPVKVSPPQKDYDGLADDWDATRPHINPPFSDPSLSTQFAALAVERPTATAPLAVMKVKKSDPVFTFDDPEMYREVTFLSDESGDEVD